MALGVTSLILVGLSSALVIASRAVPTRDDALSLQARSGELLARLADELSYAITIDEWAYNRIRFTVADRDGDGQDEQIYWIWIGGPVEALYRRYNDSELIRMAEGVGRFELDYELVSATETGSEDGESDELLLLDNAEGAQDYKFGLSSLYGIAQVFDVALPDGATDWRVTRVRVKVGQFGAVDGTVELQVREAKSYWVPGGVVLATAQADEADLDSQPGWHDFSFDNLGGLSPDQRLALLLIDPDGSTRAVYYQFGAWGVLPYMAHTSDGGASWWGSIFASMACQVYGTVSGAAAVSMRTVQRVARVDVSLQLGDDPANGLDTSVAMMGRPRVVVEDD